MHLFLFLTLIPVISIASSHQFTPEAQALMSPPTTTTTTTTIYFGYGSNLWLQQMSLRCPSSTYLGIARLNGYTWLINDRGYANVVEAAPNSSTQAAESYQDVVYGMVYALTPSDEAHLDKNEGVPIAYTKELLACDFWSAGEPAGPLDPHQKIDTTADPTATRDMLVYIDRRRVRPDEPRKEYVYRMNRGISDAVKVGVPEKYVDEVMRKYIPDDEGEDGMEGFAKEQAARFRDESGVFS